MHLISVPNTTTQIIHQQTHDGNVTETISLGALTESGTLSAKKMASYFNDEFKQLRSVNVRATAHNEIKVQSLDSSITGLLINNEAITYASTTDISGMIQAINEKSADD